MTIVPNQFFGLGDVIFEQTLVRYFGDKILWPVESQFVEGLNRAYPDITFIDKALLNINYEAKDEYTYDDLKVLPLRWADSILKVPYSDCMKSKYMLYGKDWTKWQDKAMWVRDGRKEEELCRAINIPAQYNLVNTTFGSQSQLNIPIVVNNGLPTIHMKAVAGYSLFDWAKVIENATHIHTVSTSIVYLLELLYLKAKTVNIYPRKPIEQDLRNVAYILTSHDYKLHT